MTAANLKQDSNWRERNRTSRACTEMQGTCAETQRAVQKCRERSGSIGGQNSAFLSMQLRVVQRCVNAVRLVYQFLMRADFCNFSIIDHNDFIRITHSRKPMSNDKHRTVCHKVFIACCTIASDLLSSAEVASSKILSAHF